LEKLNEDDVNGDDEQQQVDDERQQAETMHEFELFGDSGLKGISPNVIFCLFY
jgi:hypothetical protein